MTAITAMKKELARVQYLQSLCLDRHGRPKNIERYLTLTKEAVDIKKGIDWWEKEIQYEY